jgi:DNA-3-methyladenine glycosylase II
MKTLSQHDPLLATIIARMGPCTIEPHTNYYQELVSSIISQQLSTKAAAAIWQRFLHLYNDTFPMPQDIITTPIEKLRSAGLSQAKAIYVQDIAVHIMDGRLEINKLPDLPNEQIIAELTAIKGVGEWTAHMFLIFSLGRLDVLPVGDLGIKTGIQKLYGLPNSPDTKTIQELAQKHGWHPYESVASWYIWKFLEV